MPTDPAPDQPCVWVLERCDSTYDTVVGGLPLCTMHATEAISLVLTGKLTRE